jgi:predicted enzyme related to lactoylglutathione lyase
MGAPVAWFEINASDPKRAGDFYRQLFDWKLTESDQGYLLVDTGAGDGAVGGGIWGTQGPDDPGGTKVYMRVDDLQSYLDRAVQLGGTIVLGPTPLPGDFGSFALFADPDGHTVGLWV